MIPGIASPRCRLWIGRMHLLGNLPRATGQVIIGLAPCPRAAWCLTTAPDALSHAATPRLDASIESHIVTLSTLIWCEGLSLVETLAVTTVPYLG